MHNNKKTIILRVVTVAALLAVAGACVYMYLHFGKSAIELIKDTDRFKAWIEGFGVWGIIVFVAIRVLQTVVKFFPTEPIEIAAGLVWGWFGGFMLCLLGNIIGSIIILFLTSADLILSGRKCNKKEKPFPTSLLAPMRRFERPTYCLGGSCSILLSYMGILVITNLITHFHILSLKLKSCKAPILAASGRLTFA